MNEYVNVRASEILGQRELVRFLKSRFPGAAKPVGRTTIEGTECVEVRVRSKSDEFEEIRRFIDVARRTIRERVSRESRHGTHECVRHVGLQDLAWLFHYDSLGKTLLA
jgi:uncharacterized Ntn-hydrolase superfamily protein